MATNSTVKYDPKAQTLTIVMQNVSVKRGGHMSKSGKALILGSCADTVNDSGEVIRISASAYVTLRKPAAAEGKTEREVISLSQARG